MENRLPGFLFSIKNGGALESFQRPAVWLRGKVFYPSMTSPVSTSLVSTVSSPSRQSTVMREPGST